MRNKAQARICGVVVKDIKIKESRNGKKYGVITIAVNKTINSETNKPQWFTILIWNLRLLKKYSPYLTKGTNIIAEGELEVVSDSDVGHTVISIKRKSGITILAKLPFKNEEKVTSFTIDDYQKISANGIIDVSIIESIRR